MPAQSTALLIVASLLTTPLMAQQAERCGGPPDTIPIASWVSEFRAMRDTIELRHADAWRWTSREQLNRLADSIATVLPRQSPSDRVLAFARWVTAVGDGHTRLLPFAQSDSSAFRYPCRYPIEVSLFDDGIHITASADSLRSWLGARVVSIGSVDAATVLARLRSLVPHDNEHGILRLAAPYLVSPQVMQYLDLADEVGGVRWSVESPDGSTRSALFHPSNEALVPLVGATGREVRNMFREGATFATTSMGDTVLVLQLNQMSHTPELRLDSAAAQVLRELDRSAIRRVILDVRYNGGGSAELLRPFIAELAARQQSGRLEVVALLVGRGTFSAAVWNSFDLIRATGAVVIGQPSAGRPNGFGETRWVTLPRTQLRFSYSTRWNQRSSVDDTRNALIPDQSTPLLFADVRRGVDAALNAALALRSMPGR